jgi:hypothetical protein
MLIQNWCRAAFFIIKAKMVKDERLLLFKPEDTNDLAELQDRYQRLVRTIKVESGLREFHFDNGFASDQVKRGMDQLNKLVKDHPECKPENHEQIMDDLVWC